MTRKEHIRFSESMERMAGIGKTGLGGLGGGSLGGSLGPDIENVRFDPGGYLQSAGGRSDAARIWSGLQELRAIRSSAVTPPAPTVETVERLPRVIELEKEGE